MRTYRIPKTVKVHGETLKIELREHLADLDKQGHEAAGVYLDRPGKIVVASTMTEYQMRATLWHELGHWAFVRSGLVKRFGAASEERIVEGMMSWLLEVFRDAILVEYLTEGER